MTTTMSARLLHVLRPLRPLHQPPLPIFSAALRRSVRPCRLRQFSSTHLAAARTTTTTTSPPAVPVPSTAVDDDLHLPIEDSDIHFPIEDDDLHFPIEDGNLQFPTEDDDLHFPIEDGNLQFPTEDDDLHFPTEDDDLHFPTKDSDLHLHIDDSDLHPVPGRKTLRLHIERPADATPSTPTIISLPLFTPAPPAPSSAIIITPIYRGKPPTFPEVLHDVLAAVSETRLLFPESRTGLLASRFMGGIAIAAAITQGPGTIAAVAAAEPVVDVSTEGIAEGNAGWDMSTGTWRMGSGYDPMLRRQIYGSDPQLYWTDPFAGPLLFFASPGVEFPDVVSGNQYSVDPLLRFDRTRRNAKRWPPNGFVPGHGWGLLLAQKVVPRMLLSLGKGVAAEDRALFVQRANTEAEDGNPVGVVKEGLEEGAMGQWLEATLRGEEMNDVVESDSAERVLWTRFGGELPELQMQESETSIIRHGGRVKDLAALSVEALLAMDSVLKYSSKSKKPVGKGPRGIKPAKHRPSGTWSKAATGSKSATWTKAAAVSWARMAKARAAKAKSDMLSVEKLLVMDNSLWTTAKSSSAKNPTPTAASSTTPRKTPTKRSKASSSAQTATSATTPKKTPAKRSKALSSTPTPTSAATLEQTPASKPTTRSEASSSTPTPTPTPEAAPASPPPTPPPTPPATAKSNPWATVVKTSPKRAAAIKTASIKAAATKGSKGSKAAAAKANKESKAAAKAAAKAAKKPKW